MWAVQSVFLCLAAIILSVDSRSYKIQPEKIKILFTDPDYVDLDVDTIQYNDTHRSFSGTAFIRKEISLENDINILAKVFSLDNGRYKLLPVKFNFNLCDGFRYLYAIFADALMNKTNVPGDCPIVEGAYYINNFIPDDANFPEDIPKIWSKLMIYINGTDAEGNEIGSGKVYVTIQHS